MLGAVLRDFNDPVRCLDDFLVHSVHLIAEYQGVTFPGLRGEPVQHDRVQGLLHAENLVSLGAEFFQCIHRAAAIFPVHAEFRPEGGFVYFGRWRCRAYAAEEDPVSLERVCAPEHRAYIVSAPDIVQDYCYPAAWQCLVFFRSDTAHLDSQFLPMLHIVDHNVYSGSIIIQI